MITKQRELAKLRSEERDREFGDLNGFVLQTNNARGNNYQYEYPKTFVFPREQGPEYEEIKEQAIDDNQNNKAHNSNADLFEEE